MGLAGCSQPIDQGSEAPPESQALLAIIGIAALVVGYVAFRHHNIARESSGGGGGPSATAPANVITLTNKGKDLTANVSGTVGVLESSGTSFRFEEVLTSGLGFSYTLPSGFAPTAVAIDANGDEWFVDNTGLVKTCKAPSGITGTCTPISGITLSSDGLPGGPRSITADNSFFVTSVYAGGKTQLKAFSIATGVQADAQSYAFGRPLYSADAVSPVAGSCGTSICQYLFFHQNGAEFLATVGLPPAQQHGTLSPAPLSAPGVGASSFFGLIGSPTSGLYQIAQYTPGTVTISPTTRLTIANNGVANFLNGAFTLPLARLHVDTSNDSFALDSSTATKVVIFSSF